MEGVTKTMGKIMKTMDLEKTDKTMQAFEKTFEELDVLTSVSILSSFHKFLEHE